MRLAPVAAAVIAAILLGGCAEVRRDHFKEILGTGDRAVLTDSNVGVPQPPAVPEAVDTGARTLPLAEPAEATRRRRLSAPGRPELLQAGTDRYVRGPAQAGAAADDDGSGLTLNFENTSILNVIKVVLTDMLGRSYVVDPAVQGTVTLQTTRPIQRDELLPTLELMLRMNGAALVQTDGLYHVVPRDTAIQGLLVPQLGDTQRPIPTGYAVEIVPLRYISATQMQEILEPFSTPGNVVRVDVDRNLLVVAGTGQELEVIRDTVDVFDVDWMAGQTVAMFTPDYVDAQTLTDELTSIMGDPANSALAGLVRLVPIERLEALLVISPRRTYINRIGRWIAKLDRDSGSSGQRLFVYHVQNGKAVDLAAVLNDVFQTGETDSARPAEVAPGLEGVERTSANVVRRDREREEDERDRGTPARSPPAIVSQAGGASGPEGGLSIGSGGEIRIIADEINNALLILATAQQYGQVESALRELDLAPLQVLIEATIAEVKLTGELSQGVEWFFKNHLGGNNTGTGTLDLGAAGLAALVPGFSYAVTEASTVKAVINLLAQDSRANIVSSPSLMVLNNQEATIQVGDQVPITTQQQQSTSENANIVNSIEFRDTGVLLTVTPRVNAGGLVIMEVEQEVSNVAAEDANTLTPTIRQRRITSTVAVHSSETVVLGGLIREDANQVASGIPGLYKLPVIGPLFGTENDDASRTELVVLITPRAVRGIGPAREVTREFQRKMESLQPLRARVPALRDRRGEEAAEPEPETPAPTTGAREPIAADQPPALEAPAQDAVDAPAEPVAEHSAYAAVVAEEPVAVVLEELWLEPDLGAAE